MRIKDKKKEAAIVRTTLELTGEKGLAGITMSALAKRAGVATGTLYTYFKDKQELLLAVYDSVWDASLADNDYASTVGASVEEGLRAFVLAYARFVIDNRAAIVFIDQMKNSPFMTPDAAQGLLDRYRPLIDLIERGTQQGILRSAPSHEILYVVEGVIKSIVNFSLQTPDSSPGSVEEKCWQYVWRAITKS